MEPRRGEIVVGIKAKPKCRYCHGRGFEYIITTLGRRRVICRCCTIRVEDDIKWRIEDENVS